MQSILLAPGSKGDLFPFLALGKSLVQRGHQVLVITQGIHEEDVLHAGLKHAPIFSRELEEEILRLLDMAVNGTIPMRRVKPQVMRVFNEMAPQRLYSLIREHHNADHTVVASNDYLANGAASLAREKLRTRHAAIWVTPWNLRWSAPWLPSPLRNLEFSMRSMAAQIMAPGTVSRYFQARRELGLPPRWGYAKSFLYSAQTHICLFPRWFVPWFQDSLSPILFTNFPRYQGKHTTLSEKIERFLHRGPPPAVVCHASWRTDVRQYLTTCADACRAAGLRVILLSNRDLPGFDVPKDTLLSPLTSLPELLPRAALLIHQGGLGTMIEGIAARVPQLAIPYAADQPFNAVTAERLKVGCVVKPGSMHRKLSRVIAQLCQSPQFRESCMALAEQLPHKPDLANVCKTLEELDG